MTTNALEERSIQWEFLPLVRTELGEVDLREAGELTLAREFFGRFSEIRNHRFAECLIASRTMDLVQRVELELDGNAQSWEFDQRQLCGWRSLGIEPILEIKSEVTGDKWWYVFRLHSSGQWMWCQLLPMRGGPVELHMRVQFSRFFHLLVTALVTAGWYMVASLPFANLVLNWK
jgi:hypothetical protein